MNLPLKASSNIMGAVYFSTSKELIVSFNSGSYVYFGVEQSEIDSWLLADSVGSYFSKHIKNAHKYKKLDSNEEVAV